MIEKDIMEPRICADGRKDMTPVVLERLLNCRDGGVIRFEPGEYHFYPGKAFEKYYYISNNRHGLKRVALPIVGKKDIVLDGGGSRFIFHGAIMPVVVEDSANITLRNFTIDWERPFYSQGTVLAADESGVLLEIDRTQYPYRFENGEIVFEGEGWEEGLTEGVFEVDAATRAPACRSGDSLGLGFPERLTVEPAGEGKLRLTDAFPHRPAVGNILVLRHFNRHCPGIHLRQDKDIRLENIVLHHAGGMGIVAQYCENVVVKDCTVSPSGNRVFSVTVDATHFVNCRGTICLEDCLFEGQLDDPCNVHGINFRVREILGECAVKVERVHHEQHGVEVGFPGDRMAISDNRTLLSYAENRVESVEWIDERFSAVVFRKPLPAALRAGHVVENVSWTPDLHISGCTARNNRARGYLISTPGRVVVENSRIASSGAAIKISGDANYWFESGAVRNVLIRNNEFGDCCYGCGKWGRAVIDIDPEIANPLDNPECFHRNIRIENNRFFTFDTGILFARSVDGIRFRGNVLERSETYPPTGRMDALLTFEGCRNIDVGGNEQNGWSNAEWIRQDEREKVPS